MPVYTAFGMQHSTHMAAGAILLSLTARIRPEIPVSIADMKIPMPELRHAAVLAFKRYRYQFSVLPFRYLRNNNIRINGTKTAGVSDFPCQILIRAKVLPV